MTATRWRWLKEFRKLWEAPRPEPQLHAARILKIQRTIALPAKLVMLAVVSYYLFFSLWKTEMMATKGPAVQALQNLTLGYLLFTLIIATTLVLVRRFPLRRVNWLVLATGAADGIYLAATTAILGGFESTLFWAFPGLIIINALSLPLGASQLILSLSLSAFYMGAGIWNADKIMTNNTSMVMNASTLEQSLGTAPLEAPTARSPAYPSPAARHRMVAAAMQGMDVSSERYLLRLIVLWLLTACCYGVQALAARQRQVEEEAREFAVRQGQLRTAGRLAAEIAHQIKNPLAIINNAAFSLRRAVTSGKTDVMQQIEIIQEEVERSDRIITQIMGYARLAEGRVEKLGVTEELNRALAEVFPPAIGYDVQIERDFAPNLPPLLMQRAHLATVLVNLLQNAREALNGHGHVRVSATATADFSVKIVIADNGPGIPPEQTERIFEAYFTTKEKGTGLGLAIVKHDVDLYGGDIRMESELGKGSRFILEFPAKTLGLLPKDL